MDQSVPVNACVCASCKNHIAGTFTCKAFPDGIPEEVVLGENDHSKSINGDNGIMFEQADDVEIEEDKSADQTQKAIMAELATLEYYAQNRIKKNANSGPLSQAS